jgi:hypothetical protein
LHKAEILEKRKAYAEANKERIKAYKKEYAKKRKEDQKNK